MVMAAVQKMDGGSEPERREKASRHSSKFKGTVANKSVVVLTVEATIAVESEGPGVWWSKVTFEVLREEAEALRRFGDDFERMEERSGMRTTHSRLDLRQRAHGGDSAPIHLIYFPDLDQQSSEEDEGFTFSLRHATHATAAAPAKRGNGR
ncbi:hypothetical protein FQN50_005185 [Emmonsiellopsis sp. PD_5]|nr:hypothetical protein FQN50_005185 [Emmonsiellopsis sp. PD_5]